MMVDAQCPAFLQVLLYPAVLEEEVDCQVSGQREHPGAERALARRGPWVPTWAANTAAICSGFPTRTLSVTSASKKHRARRRSSKASV